MAKDPHPLPPPPEDRGRGKNFKEMGAFGPHLLENLYRTQGRLDRIVDFGLRDWTPPHPAPYPYTPQEINSL